MHLVPLLFAALTGVTSSHVMVVSEQHLASDAGVAVLRAGGNAVDAAVAVGYALAVVDPCCGNIGGGGFMVVRMHDGRERFIDFREKAPMAATATMFQDARGNVVPERSRKGWLAVGVPGTVMGFERARTEFGRFTRARLMAPAIALARDGYIFASGDALPFAGSTAEDYGGYSFDTQPNVRAIWKPHGRFPVAGERVVQPQLARTLETIARGGSGAFYRGTIAHAVVRASREGGGLLTMADFAGYTVDELQPVHCAFQGYDVMSAPPPSSGGVTLCETIGIIGNFSFSRYAWHGIQETHRVIESERRAYADRNAYLGDPAFVRNPVAQLLDPAYDARRRAEIEAARATPSRDVRPGLAVDVHENGETTHYSIVDAQGNAVAVTYTINDWFGAGIIAGDTGFFLNDEMDDFTSKPGVANMFGLVQGERNAVAPGKRPLSSMSPTIVARHGKLAMVTGSPGGSRIITTTLETLIDVLCYHMDAQRAVDAPRMHMQWLPDAIDYEPGAFDEATMRALRSDGYRFSPIAAWGSAQTIVVDSGGRLHGGTDRRHPAGAAVGY